MSSHVTCSNVKRDQGLALEYYRSYNLSWYDTTQYTATVRQARLNPFERPKKSNRKSAPFCFLLAVALVKFTLFLHRCVFGVTSMMWRAWCEISNMATASSKSCLDHFCFSGGHGKAEDLRWGLSRSIAWAVWCVDFFPSFCQTILRDFIDLSYCRWSTVHLQIRTFKYIQATYMT